MRKRRPTIDQILEASAESERLVAGPPPYTRIDELWFPGGFEVLAKVRSGDAFALDAATLFLAADPYHHGSGYIKVDLWRWLRRLPLSPRHLDRLEHAAMKYLKKPIRQEFWPMCKAMPKLGRTPFWGQVWKIAKGDDASESFRAEFLLLAAADVHAAAKVRRDMAIEYTIERYGSGTYR